MLKLEPRLAALRINVHNLPAPRRDELLYSLIARSAVHVGYWNAKPFLRALYHGITKPACPDLPGALERVTSSSGGAWGTDARAIALQHTLLPYFTYFLPALGQEAVMQHICAGTGHLHMTLGINASGVRPIEYFRMCATCTQGDIGEFGETYWRRTHHLPGVFVCPEHGESLLETEVPFRPVRRYEHAYARPDLLKRATALRPPCDRDELLLDIANQSRRLLEEPPAGTVDYRKVMARHGFSGRHGAPARFREAVEAVLPKSLLASLFTELGSDGFPHWVDSARRKPRALMHPLKHVLVQLVLDSVAELSISPSESRRPDFRGKSLNPGLRAEARALAQRGLSVRAIATRLTCDWKTADRLLKPIPVPETTPGSKKSSRDREAWLERCRANPKATKTELRRIENALYKRLYRNDREWLLAHGPKRASPTPKLRVNWAERDAELARAVEREADRLATQEPPVRITRTRVLTTLRMDTSFYRHLGKLPRTAEVLAARTESIESFQVRRLRAVMRASDESDKDWLMLRLARIDAQRLADKGASLVAAARREAPCT
jgi:hypothetical protein